MKICALVPTTITRLPSALTNHCVRGQSSIFQPFQSVGVRSFSSNKFRCESRIDSSPIVELPNKSCTRLSKLSIFLPCSCTYTRPNTDRTRLQHIIFLEPHAWPPLCLAHQYYHTPLPVIRRTEYQRNLLRHALCR